jgi:pimeloyl-ACP methyl ester carboxylesterase
MTRILIYTAFGFLALVLGTALFQRKLLYYPSHHREQGGLSPWHHDGRLMGFAREVPSPENVWLLLHGNAGQASDRAYALPSFSERDSVFILEYPGYGERPGSPSLATLNGAALEAYGLLRARFPKTPVCVAAESVGSGPASILAKAPRPPDKIVLVVPFDTLARVAAHHFPYLPVSLILRDRWDNTAALKGYQGPVEIFGARDDSIIPVSHARALAQSLPAARFHEIAGGHNDWADKGRVVIRNP